MKVLVTGADGFLGNNIVREVLDRGHEVYAFIQQGRHIKTLDELTVTKRYGDLLNAEEVIQAAEGCDYIIHAAANTSIWPQRSEITRRVNHEGTLNVIQAALQAKVKRMVSIGSANSFGNGSLENPGDESSPFAAGKYGLDYIDSKRDAQEAIIDHVENHGLDAVIINPTFMLGPYDTKPSSGELLLALYHQKIPGYTASGRNFIYVKDVAVAAANALTMGRSGECYIMANENLSYKDFNQLVADELDVQPPKLLIPKPFILLYGAVSQMWAYLTGKPPVVSYAVAQISLDTNYYTAAKAVKELQLPQTPIKIAVREAFNWFQENGYLNKGTARK
ncbi:NAD-dependent epimerase/dehydratase family protein [Lewinella cohaerens]|uniref:NAD-dependent epimerase/dehydratase family protein n=1 Tax=Lewinella cohaerens TaxID=70995 RepID=UPI0003603463|nr:NAD-dependent epimerase/dehydratase family protein [Lewinella cohaerens]